MINAVVQTFLAYIPLADPSATISPSEVTPSTDAQVQIDTLSNDAHTDGATLSTRSIFTSLLVLIFYFFILF